MEAISKKKAVAWTSATVFGSLGIIVFFSNAYVAYWYVRTAHQGPPPMQVVVKGTMAMTGPGLWLTVGIWWLIHRRKAPFAELFATKTDSVLKDLLVGAALGAVWVALYGAFNVVSFAEMFVLDRAKLISLPTSVSAGFCEEFLFRGFVFLVIARAGGSGKHRIVYSSLAFGLAHVFWGPWGMLWTVVLGFTLAAVRLWRGSVWPAVAAHMVLDLCIEPALLDKAMSGGFG